MLVNKENFNAAVNSITSDACVVDIETEGLDIWNNHKLCGIGICNSEMETFYFPFRHKNNLESMPLMAFFLTEDMNLPLEYMQPIFKRLRKTKILIGHNLKFDLAGLKQDGFEISDHQRLEDTMTLARLYFPNKWDRLNLEIVSMKVLKLDEKWKGKFQEYLAKNKIKNHFDMGSPEVVGEYCESDCKNTWRIREIMLDKIKFTDQLRVYNQETELLKVVWEMEQSGLYFDRAYLIEKMPLLQGRLDKLALEIYELIGYEFDILSNSQLGKALESIGLQSPGLTPTGQPKWGSAELLYFDNRITTLILEFRGLEKMLGTYFKPLLNWNYDFVHTNFVIAGPITGRMACRNPNLQNLTKKSFSVSDDEEEQDAEVMAAVKAMLGVGSEQSISTGKSFSGLAGFSESDEKIRDNISVRRLYTHPEDYLFYAIDYSQMEMRIFADYVKDQPLIDSLESGEFDFHSHVAKEVWGATEDSPLWKFYRTLAKNINFGMIYGIGTKKLAAGINKTHEEAIQYKADYFQRFPKALKFMQQVTRIIEQRGYVSNRYGRRYWVEKDKAYRGVNYLVQGTSADIVKNRMIATRNMLVENNYKSRMAAQVHDEVIFYIHQSEEKEVVLKLKDVMEERCIDTFLPVDVSRGKSWADKSEICLKCFEFRKECLCNK